MGESAAAFTAVYERHYAAVLRFAVRRVGEAHARDVVAETFLIAWRRWTDRPTDDALPWLYRTVGNDPSWGVRRYGCYSDRIGGRHGNQA